MKKLKFWSRKKRKRKQACPSQAHQCSCEYSSVLSAVEPVAEAVVVEPTAPPFPFWFDEIGSVSAPDTSAFPWNTQLPHNQEETIVETSPLLSQVSDLRIYQSYQQYMVPNPSYGVPIVDAAPAKKSMGMFGCVIEVSLNVIRCFFPCFCN
ncbi:hypothetical protein EUTSA_v10026492mg [Eutrema salsugineum]|uniref:Uncharacterized protein n=1 Tax=Eutrema salsugineum TaxID=72664 RepID=V4P5V9_EUTSA|nr:hypothetical protein EUTSA_v10026492mg [Eutrema salsugineum]